MAAKSITLPNKWLPRDYQHGIMSFFDNGGKRGVWLCHRRAGKDSTMLNQTAKMAMQRVGTYWHLLPSQRQGRKVVWEGIDKAGRRMIDQAFPPELRLSTNNTEMIIKFKNGSIFQVVGSDSYDALVGANPIHVTFSEWALSKPSAWDFIRPILLENDGTAAFIYTPRGKNHGYTLYQMAKNNPEWYCETLTIEDTKALPLSALAEEREAGMPEDLIQQEYYCSFTAQNTGSFYGEDLDTMLQLGLIDDFAFDTTECYTHWDIGFTDSTAIWVWRFRPDGGVDVVDCYEASGLSVNHYVEWLAKRPYTYKGHFLPHDGNDGRFKFATGLTIREQIMAALRNIRITPKIKINDGIQAVRVLLNRKTRIHATNCKNGILALENYQREYNEDTRTFSKIPKHDWSSHYADAFRYLAVSVEALWKLDESYSRVEKIKRKPEITPQGVTLGNVWEENTHEYN